jgi:membrane fusion protein, multidrug efflux system
MVQHASTRIARGQPLVEHINMKYTSHTRRYAIVAGAILLASGAAGCSSEQAPAPQIRPVRSVAVSATSGGGTTTYTAEIRSRHETDLSFQVGGKLISRTADAGMTVKKGALLAQLDQTDQRLGVDASRSAVNAARAELDRVRTEEARYRELLERGLTTRAAYVAQQTAVKTSQSKLDQASADLRLSEQKLAYTTLRADDDGVVTRVMAEVGSVVSAGQRVLSIAQPSELEAVFDVPDGSIDEIRATSIAQVALMANPTVLYPASVREISPSADPVTRTYQVKTSIPKPPANLRLGMTVTVTLAQVGERTAVALLSTALFQKEHDPAVWIVREDLTLELRPVVVERYESDRVLIAAGLKVGERVVTAGVHRLAAGDKVRLIEGANR